MKKLLLLLLTIVTLGFAAAPLSAQETLTIGTGTSAAAGSPFDNLWKNSWCENIYLASEIEANGNISSIAFYYGGTATSTYTYLTLKVYMGTTSRSSISSTTDWTPEDDLTLVYNGANITNPTTQGWFNIELDEPFFYNGTDNLVVVVSKTVSTYNSSFTYRYTSTSPNYLAMRCHNDNDVSYAEYPGTAHAGTQDYSRANIQLTISPAGNFCHAVSHLTVDEITSDGATISWNAPEDAGSYILQYKTAAQSWDDDEVETVYPYDTVYDSFSSLNPNTTYNVRVANMCSNGDTSSWRSVTFKTSCTEIVNLPISFNLDDVTGSTSSTTNNLPDCWNYFNDGTVSTYAGCPSVYSNSTYAYSGSNSLRFYTWTGTTYGNQTAILPPIDADLFPVNELQVSFGARCYSTYTLNIIVGVMTNPEDITTFVPIDTITTSSQTYSFYDIPLDSYTGTGNYIALMAPKPTSSYNAGYIDNIEVTVIPGCTRPSNLTQVSATETSATLSWESTGNFFNLYYKAGSDSAYTEIENISLDDDSTYTINNLASAIICEWYVTALCDDGTEISSFSHSTFRTECSVVSEFPWFEGFEAAWEPVSAFGQTTPTPNCWKIYNGGATSSSYNWTWRYNTTAGRVYEGNSSAGCYTDYATSNHNDWLITPLMQLDGNQMVSFYAQRATAATAEPDEISIWISDEDAELIAPDSTNAPLPGFTQLFQTDIPQGAFQRYEVSLADYSGNRYIAFVRRNTPNDGYWLALDNVEVRDIPECAAPNTLETSNPSTTEVTLSWIGNTSSYNLYYREASDTSYTQVPNVTLDDDGEYVLTGLTSSTAYVWYVSAVCTDGTEMQSYTTSTFITLCETITQLPIVWDFEASNPLNNMPICWSVLNQGSSGPTVKLNSPSDSYHGSGHLYLYNYTPHSTMVLPPFDTDANPINTLRLRFYAKNLGTYPAWDVVVAGGVMTDPTDASTYTLVDSIHVVGAAGGEYTEYTLSFTQYEGEGQYIALQFYTINGSQWLRVDDMTLEVAPSCTAPDSLAMVSSTTSSATLTWQSDASDLTLYYKSQSDNNYTAVQNVSLDSEDSYTLSDLPASTNFSWYLVADCGDGTVAASSISSFNTQCDIITQLPWFEGFESSWGVTSAFGQNNESPLCWKVYDGGATSSTYVWKWKYNNTAGRVYEGNSSAVCYTDYASSNHNDWLISPMIQLDGNQQLSFYAQRATASTTEPDEISIWISDEDAELTAPSSTNSPLPGFTQLFQTDIPSGAFQQYTVSLYGYSGNRYIAFVRRNTPNDGYYLSLDNVLVSDLPECVTPSNLQVVSLGATEASVSWSSNATDFNFYYKASTESTWAEDEGVSLNEDGVYILSNLDPSTTYQWYVESVCTDTNKASAIQTFTTPCLSFEVTADNPFVENFDSITSGIPDCWDNSEGTTTDASYKWNYYATGQSGHCLRFNSYNNSNGKTNMLKTPVLDLTAITDPIVSFSYKNPTGGDFSVYLSTDGGNTYPTALATGLTGATTWQEVAYILPDLTDAENVVIVFAGTSNYGTGDAYIYLDNVYVGAVPSCPKPTSLSATNVDAHSVTLSWTTIGNESEWEIVYGAPGFNTDTVTPVNASTNPFTIENLTPSTTYEFYVRTICDNDEYSLWSNVYTATTACLPITLPYTENFDTYSTGSTAAFVDCWDRHNTYSATTNYPYVNSSSSYAHSGGKCLYFYNSSTTYSMARLPMVDVTTNPVNTLQISFWMRPGALTNKMVVGVMTNPNDFSTFVPVDTVANTAVALEYHEVPLNNYTGNGAYVALKMLNEGSTYTLYLDDVTLEEIPSCPRPTDLAATASTTSSITLAWQSMNASSWEIAYGTPGFNPDSTAATIVPASTNPFTVQNLSTSSSYQFYVRSLCSATDASPWSLPIYASTECDIASLPYTEDFESYVGTTYNDAHGITPNCWTEYGPSTTYGVPHITSSGDYHWAHSGTNCLVFTGTTNAPNQYAALPTFDQPLNTLKLNFWRRMENASYGTLTVGYVTNLNDLPNSFVAIDTIPSIAVDSLADTISVYFTGAPANGNICFHWYKDGLYYSCCIDDVVVTLADDTTGPGPVVTTYTVTLNTADATMGSVTPDTVATVNAGSSFTATATPNNGYVFVAWMDGTTQVSTANPYTFTVNANTTLTATFATEPTEPCDVPTGLHTTSVENNSVTIAWDANDNANSWNIRYRVVNGTWNTAANVLTNSYTISGLEGSTDYEFQVQANCGDDNHSAWSASVTAHTTNVGIVSHLENSVTLFPNPAKEYIDVRIDGEFNVNTMEVYDVYGKLISNVNVIDNPTRINVSNLANGMYFVRVTTDAGVVTKTFVKK